MATAAFGVTNIDHPLEVIAETLFQIGSITKTFTALAVRRLVDRGMLELDASVRTYLPDFKVLDEATTTGVTTRHLLTHTANWTGDFDVITHRFAAGHGAGRDGPVVLRPWGLPAPSVRTATVKGG